jgi:phytoene synthase
MMQGASTFGTRVVPRQPVLKKLALRRDLPPRIRHILTGLLGICTRSLAQSVGAALDEYDDLLDYMDGSAAVIGEMMLPILEPSSPAAAPHARDLGIAFQLTNFLRDVSEDLDRGRVYLPQEDVRRFGASPGERCVSARGRAHALRLPGPQYYVRRPRDPVPAGGVGALHQTRRLYSAILDQIEASDYDVFTARARVPSWRKALVVSRSIRPGRR